MKIFLDDVREVPEGWTLATSYKQFMDIVEKHAAEITHMSLDHDLGEEKTGYDAVKKIAWRDDLTSLETVVIHTSNPVGFDNMSRYMMSKHPWSKLSAFDGVKIRRINPVINDLNKELEWL